MSARTLVGTPDPEPEWLSIGSWAVRWGVSFGEAHARLARAARRGEMRTCKVGNRRYFAPGEVRS